MKRILSLDLARGFTVLIMPSVHVVMLYSRPDVQQSLFGDILAFLAEGPGAQLFMLLMGISFTFSSRISTKSVLQRTFYLLLAAFGLNFLKFIIPLLGGWMPAALLLELQLSNRHSAILFFLLLGDIFHFAALAYPILYMTFRLKNYQWWSIAFAAAIIIASPLFWDLKSPLIFVNWVFALTGGHPPQAFFPLFPWLVYPVIGLAIGHFLKQYGTRIVMKTTGMIGASLLFTSCLFPATIGVNQWLPFYRTQAPDTLFHIGLVLLWLAAFHFISKKVPNNLFFRLLVFCSRNITAIYIIQWILIFWLIGFAGYQTNGFLKSFCWMGIISLATLALTCSLKIKNAGQKSL